MMKSEELEKVKNVHILGIGGIGVSALARLFQSEGKEVSGQDSSDSPVIVELKKKGIQVLIGQDVKRIPKNTDLVIYSRALSQRNPMFLRRLKALSIPLLSYPEALGLVSRGKYTIAIAGTHGKTTTTAMVAKVFTDAKLDPTVIVGSLLKGQNSNFIAGKSKYLVVEADEYQRSFLELAPSILVITNIGVDHLDYYKDAGDIQSAFAQLAAKVPRSGYLIVPAQHPEIRAVVIATKAKVVDYRVFLDKRMQLPLPGGHNQENAAAALARFRGTWRRFDLKGKTNTGALVYDDYAHNPDKVLAALAGYREVHPNQHLVVVFQPHLYSRTKTLLEGFSSAFDEADEVMVAPIFAARERRDPSISSRILAQHIEIHLKKIGKKKPVVMHVATRDALEKILRKKLTKKDVLITMGAGDIYQLAEKLIKPDKKRAV